ncbi:MAG: hypothetical protein KAU50_09735, partial [Candidatus Marinimicrobia bacterium]|nr:hypothetical protein [Candidatus Neomarinimicrobiota bacterium]
HFRKSAFAALIVAVSVSGLSGQFRASPSEVTESEQLRSVAGVSWLDPQRFAMNHSFSASFLSGEGPYSGGLSVYSNSMRYIMTDNLLLSGNFHILQPAMGAGGLPGENNMMLYYQTSLHWQITPRINFQLGLSNTPRRQYNSYLPDYYYPLLYRPLSRDPGILE